MALLRDYEIPGTGLIVPNAYHVVANVKVEKRMQDMTPPPDASREDGLTDGDRGPEVYWKAGYVACVTITIWASQQAREDGKDPIGFAGISPTETSFDGNVGTKGVDHLCMFMIDSTSTDSYTQQAYTHLLQCTDFYKECPMV